MSLTPAIIDAMVQAGCTAAQLAAAMKADLEERNAGKVARRASDAERQRKSRSNRACHAMSRNVTVTECDPPNDIYSNPPELSPSEAKASLAPKGKTRKGTRLPDDWQPEALTGEIATAVCAWQPGMLERELARFRDYWTAKSGRTAAKQDWQAAWRNWLRNADEWTSNGTANRKNTAPRQAGRSPDGFMSALREVADRKPDVSGFEPAGSFSVARLGAC